MVEMGQQTLQAPRFVGGATIVSGGLTVTAGGITVTAGDLTMTAGDISMGANKLKTTNLSLYESSSVLKVRNAAGSADAALSAAALTLSGDLSLAGNNLKTTNLLLKEGDASTLHLKNSADAVFRNLQMQQLDFATQLCKSGSGTVKVNPLVTSSLDYQSHSGSAYVSCIKLLGGVAEIAAGKLTGNLNCNTLDLNSVRSINMTSYFDMTQRTKPGNPNAGIVRLYPKDKGGNLTALFALFDDGTEVEIASEV